MFEQYSIQRGEFANELLHAGRSLGLEVDNPLGVTGILHAGWMELRGALTGHSERQILEECQRGEDLSLKTYRQALNMNINPEVREILQRQVSDVENAGRHIRSLIETTGETTAGRTRKAY